MSPSRRTLALLVGWLALSFAASVFGALREVWLLGGVALLALLGLDALLLARTGELAVERQAPSTFAVGGESEVSLRITNRGARRVRLVAYDHPPRSAAASGLPAQLAIASGGWTELRYRLRPQQRGEHAFAPAELLIDSPLALWRLRRRAGAGQLLRVYPDFRALMRYNLLATDNRTSQLGIRQRPRRGEGLDFHQLREYREGDALRQIDWKATMRLRKTISREYQDERDQQIVFLLDCGRKMHARDGELSHFDHALNSLLLLAHIALRQGDAVGLLSFSGQARWLAPRKGSAQLGAIMNALFDLQTSNRASDYVRAAQELSRRVSKRALVVLVSNLRDEDHQELALAARLLGRSHLVLVASMKERVLRQALETTARGFDEALRVAATHQYLQQRRRAHQMLRATGLLCLDVEPQQLPVALVNGYFDVKRAGVL